MKIDEAIRIINRIERTLAPYMSATDADAIRLGIEALKFIKVLRGNGVITRAVRLPGETEE